MKTPSSIFTAAWALSLAAILNSGCSTVPETGRSQFNFISPQEETAMGLSAFTQMKEEVPISKDAQLNALVTRVGQRIAAVVPEKTCQMRHGNSWYLKATR